MLYTGTISESGVLCYNEEIVWLNPFSFSHTANYQTQFYIWHKMDTATLCICVCVCVCACVCETGACMCVLVAWCMFKCWYMHACVCALGCHNIIFHVMSILCHNIRQAMSYHFTSRHVVCHEYHGIPSVYMFGCMYVYVCVGVCVHMCVGVCIPTHVFNTAPQQHVPCLFLVE